MRNLIIGSILVVVVISLMGCAIGPMPYGYGLNSGVYGYPGYGYGDYYGGWGPHWVPGYQRWVCEGPPSNTRCYWTWEPAHYE